MQYTQTSLVRPTFLRSMLCVLAWVVAGVAFVTAFSAVVPFNMDEFIHYHPLLCHFYPGNMLNTFREHCRGYDLNFANTGWVLPLRAFPYSGSFPGLLYLPLFALWPSALSARFLGLLFLAAQAGLLARMTGLRFRWILLVLLAFFPYAFQHLVDTGPVGFHITSIFLLAYLFDRWFALRRARYVVTAAVIVFCGIWTKLAYFWLLPGIGILFVRAYADYRYALRRSDVLPLLSQGSAAMLLLLFLTSLLFLSTDPGNAAVHPYLDQLRSSPSIPLRELFAGPDGSLLGGRWWTTEVVMRLRNPFEAIHRIFAVPVPTLLTHTTAFLLYLSFPFIALILRLLRAVTWAQVGRSMVSYAAFVVTVLMIARTAHAGAMHHAVLALPFLVIAASELVAAAHRPHHAAEHHRRRGKRFLLLPLTAYLVLNGIIYNAFPAQPVHAHDDPSKVMLHALLRDPAIAGGYFTVVTDWGMYYYQGLFGGRDQSVIYMEPLDGQWHIDRLRELQAQHGRRLLFVYNERSRSSNLDLIQSSFSVRPCKAIEENAVWQMLLEDDGNPSNPCFAEHPASQPTNAQFLGALLW